MPVDISFNPPGTRASLVFSHDPGNLLTGEIVAGLHAALDDLADLPHLRLVTIEGAGPDFSFGASIPEHLPDEIARVLPATHALLSALLPAPTRPSADEASEEPAAETGTNHSGFTDDPDARSSLFARLITNGRNSAPPVPTTNSRIPRSRSSCPAGSCGANRS